MQSTSCVTLSSDFSFMSVTSTAHCRAADSDTEQDLLEAACADLHAWLERDAACTSFTQPLLFFKGFQALQAYRLAHWLWLHDRKVGRRGGDVRNDRNPVAEMREDIGIPKSLPPLTPWLWLHNRQEWGQMQT